MDNYTSLCEANHLPLSIEIIFNNNSSDNAGENFAQR